MNLNLKDDDFGSYPLYSIKYKEKLLFQMKMLLNTWMAKNGLAKVVMELKYNKSQWNKKRRLRFRYYP